ncbi:holotricin-3-like [Penaeus indicus]|uniref:holotricin-3-like n=1 Tax=Penaeus indicus TaxID=29960 RepID=UPI00300C1F42
MARNVAVTSLIVALCLIAAVAGHSTYGIGGHRPVVHGSGVLGGVHGGVHGGVLGGVHSGVLGGVHGGVHGGSVHGVGLVGSGIHGAGSFNTAHYPGLVPGYSFYDQRPVLGYNTCKYWCKSNYTNKYYCCQRPYQG